MSEIIKGKCEATLQLKKLVEMVAKSNSTVLLRGETGCGIESEWELVSILIGERSEVIDHNSSFSCEMSGRLIFNRFSLIFFPLIFLSGKIITALSITFFNSLTLPGHTYSWSALIPELSIWGIIDPLYFRSSKIWFTRIGISSFLSAREGISIGNTFILKNKSALKWPSSIFFSMSWCVAQISLKSVSYTHLTLPTKA